MKISPSHWSFIIATISFCLIHVTDTRSLKKPVSSKKAHKRQYLSNAVTLGQAFVQDNASPPQAALAQMNGNPGDKSTEFQGTGKYRDAGCFKDTETRAVPILEGSDPELTGFYKQRQDPIGKCATVARSRGFQLFAIQNGGMCLSGPKAPDTYKVHGLARNCKDGKGGPWANDVYIFNDYPLEIHIFTGTLPKAGTDTNVYITLSGSMGSSRRVALTPSTDHNPFEAGQKDVFNVNTIPLGSITGITIGHDDSAQPTAGWFLEKVVVKDEANNMYQFKVNRWFAKDEDDGLIERELSLTATIKPGSYRSLGCFKERTDVNKERAVPSLEGRDEVLDGQGTITYKGREYPIEKCADAAQRRGYVMFGIQDGGLCATSKEIGNTYDMYGESNDCHADGTGSIFSSTIYTFLDQEPGFKDAEGTASAQTKGTDASTSQQVPPSDPAMQTTGQGPPSQAPSAATQGTSQTGNTVNGLGSTQNKETSATSSNGGGGPASKLEPTINKETTTKNPSNITPSTPDTSTAGSESGATKPDTSTGGSESGATKPDTSTGGSESGGTKPDTSTGGSESGATKPDTSTGGSESGATKPDTSTGGSESGATKPDTSTGGSESGATKPDTFTGGSESGTTKPDTSTGKAESGTTNSGGSTEKIDTPGNKADTSTGNTDTTTKEPDTEKPDTSTEKPEMSPERPVVKPPIMSTGQKTTEQSGSKANENKQEASTDANSKTSEGENMKENGLTPSTGQEGNVMGKISTGPEKATPQEPKTHPSREGGNIPSPNPEPSTAIEAPITPGVHKIPPEYRLPGESSSPPSYSTVTRNKVTLKQAEKTISMPFNKLLLDGPRKEENYMFFPPYNK